MTEPLKCRGVSRDGENPHAAIVYFDRELTQDELRTLHENLSQPASPAPVWRPDWEGFGRSMVEDWPTGDIDGSYLFDMSLKYGLIAEVPGGYNPDEHIDAEGICPERGDPWYEYTFGPERTPSDTPGNTDPMTIAKYDDELRKASPAPVWRDISTAPRDHTRILLFVPPYGVSCGHFDCVWENGVERWIMHSVLNKDAQPTAWMPLPDAPDGGLAR